MEGGLAALAEKYFGFLWRKIYGQNIGDRIYNLEWLKPTLSASVLGFLIFSCWGKEREIKNVPDGFNSPV